MRKSRRVVEYDGIPVIETSEHKANKPRKDIRTGNSRAGNGRGKGKLFDKVKPQA